MSLIYFRDDQTNEHVRVGTDNPLPVTFPSSGPSVPTIYNVTLTSANTEYSQALPPNCRRFDIQPQTNVDVRFAFTTGKVATPTAPYATMKAGNPYNSGDVYQGGAPSTLYFASGTAGTIVEIVAWS
jgi:hypothetical protein